MIKCYKVAQPVKWDLTNAANWTNRLLGLDNPYQGRVRFTPDRLWKGGKVISEKCPNCHGEGNISVANGPDDFDLEFCEYCKGKGFINK